MFRNFLIIAYLSLAITIGVAHQYHFLWSWPVIAGLFLAEAALLRIFSREENFAPRWNLILFLQFPLFLLILWNHYWPVLNIKILLFIILLLSVLFAFYSRRRTVTEKTISGLAFLTLPLLISSMLGNHFGLIKTSNEWTLLAEEGQIMSWVTRVLHGQVPFRDVVVTRGPLIIYSTALFLKWFGQTLLMKKVWFSILNLMMAYATYYFCRTFISSKLLRWSAFIAMFLIHNLTYRTGFAFLALALFWISLQKSEKKWALYSGVAVALALLSSKDAGLACSVTLFAVSIAGFLFHSGQRILYRNSGLGVLLGMALVLLPLAIVLNIRGELKQVLDGMIVYPKYAMLGFAASPYPNLVRMIQADLSFQNLLFPITRKIFILWYFPVLIYLFSFFLLLRWVFLKKIDAKALMTFTVATFGWLLYRSALGRSDFHHLYFCVSPAFVLLAIHADRILQIRTRSSMRYEKILVISLALLAPLLFLAQRPSDNLEPAKRSFLSNILGNSSLPDDYEPFAIERMKGVMAKRSLRRRIEAVVSAVQPRLSPEERLYAFPNMPLYYFLLDTPCPTRFEWAYQAITHEMRLEVVRDLEEKKPKFIIYSMDPKQRLDRIPLEEAVPEIAEYLRENYKPWAVFGREEIWIPKRLHFRSPRPLPDKRSDPDERASDEEGRDE